MVGVPFSREEEEDVASLDSGFRDVFRLEHAFALRLVEELIFVEGSSFLDIEVITVGVPLGGIGFSRGDDFPSHGTDGETPFGVSFCCYQIFTGLHIGFLLIV